MKTIIAAIAAVALGVGALYTYQKSVPNSRARVLSGTETNSVYGPDIEKDHEFKDLRFLTFGTSRTWGSYLENRSYAYPWLLSENATNLAIPGAGPEVPSLCTYCLVKDQVYDVIVFEYFFHANEYLIRLARRLRQRFPDATFIFMVIWSPFQFEFRGSGPNRGKNLKTMVEELSAEADTSLNVYNEIVKKTDPKDWHYMVHPRAKASLERAVEETNGITISPFLNEDNFRNSLAIFGNLFHHDTVHFSEYGHRWMRNAIVNILRATETKRTTKVNEWASQDFCVNWYTKFWKHKMLPHDDKLVLNRFKENKFALEMRDTKTSWIKVYNTMGKPAEVIMTYMSMGPRDTKYPKIRAKLSNSVDNQDGVEIYPFERERAYMVHVVAEKTIGTIPPGESTLSLEILEDNEQPFRITGIMVTPPFDRSELNGLVLMRKK